MQPKLFDTHTHFNFNAFKDDSKEIMEKTLKAGIWFVNVGSEKKTSERAVKMASENEEGVFASVGLHPIHTFEDNFEEEIKGEKVKFKTEEEEFEKEFYKDLVRKNPKVVAVGETGLDYFHIKKFPKELQQKLKEKQKEVFTSQMELAYETRKPLILHCRPLFGYDAYEDLLSIMKERKKYFSDHPGILHCFSANLEIMKEFLELGFSLGFNGIITFTTDYNELVIEAPLSKIVLETDSPWLTPAPYRGKRNESIYVEEVAKKVGELKGICFEEVAEATTKNSKRIFKL